MISEFVEIEIFSDKNKSSLIKIRLLLFYYKNLCSLFMLYLRYRGDDKIEPFIIIYIGLGKTILIVDDV